MNKTPNYIVVLDYYAGRVIKIKLTDEDKKFLNEEDGSVEEVVDYYADQCRFHMTDVNWMALDELNEETVNI